jgi:hypothetical protein
VQLPCIPFQGLLLTKQKRNDDNDNGNDNINDNKPLVSFWFSHSINNVMCSLSDKLRQQGLGDIRYIAFGFDCWWNPMSIRPKICSGVAWQH